MLRTQANALDWIEYIWVRAVALVVTVLPWSWARAIVRCLSHATRLVDRSARKSEAVQNLRLAFPGMSEREAKRIVRDVYVHLGEMVVDGVKFGRLCAKGRSREVLVLEGFEKLDGLPRESGLILVTGHYGWWELLGAACASIGYPVSTTMRERGNPLIRAYLNRLRGSTGQRLLDKNGGMRQVVRSLRAGDNVGFLVDQDARRRGIFVDFFGRPASTVTSPARLSVDIGCPIAFVYAERLADGRRFRITLGDLIMPDRTADRDTEVRRITERISRDLEEVVRRSPSLWLWLHRRWKTYPGKYKGMGS
jgi:KDO2-lipid IV(A) lauroyltransferase